MYTYVYIRKRGIITRIYIYIHTHTRNNTIYTFNQYNRIKGNNINVGYIDTAMVIIPFILCTNIKWKLDIYEADGYYIKECIDNNRDKHVCIDVVVIIFYNKYVFKVFFNKCIFLLYILIYFYLFLFH